VRLYRQRVVDDEESVKIVVKGVRVLFVPYKRAKIKIIIILLFILLRLRSGIAHSRTLTPALALFRDAHVK